MHGAEANIAALLAAWRRSGRALFHVRHDSTFPDSPYRPGQAGNEFKPEVRPLPGETVVAKRTNSAFIGTELEALLRQRRPRHAGRRRRATHNSVEATVRMAGNLGFATIIVGRRDLGDGQGRICAAGAGPPRTCTSSRSPT